MTLLEVRDLEVVAGGKRLLEVPEFSVGLGELLAVLGPTAAGKSTLLRALHGLERPARGRYEWRGTRVEAPFPVASVRRRITMVFQDPLLLAGRVLGNVVRGLQFRGMEPGESKRRARSALRSLNVEHLADRDVSGLSGGEAQRVALARALAVEPELLLLDEPLASLDLNTRDQVRAELVRVLRERRITCVWVTHDQDEAQMLGDRVVVLDAGQLLQVGPGEDVFLRPASIRVAELVRTRNLLPGIAGDGEVLIGPHRLSAPAESRRGPVTVCIRPEEIELSRDGELRGTIRALRSVGALQEITISCGADLEILALVQRRAAAEVGVAIGESVAVHIPPASIHLLP